MAFELLKHAIKMIVDNIVEALKASVVLVIVLTVLVTMLGRAIGLPPNAMVRIQESMGSMMEGEMTPELMQLISDFTTFTFVSSAISLVLMSWVAVIWHRFILLGESPTAVPQFAGKNVGAYIMQLITLFAILIGAGVVLLMIGGILGSLIPVFAVLVPFALVVILGIAYLRLALTLPPIALGERLGIREAWDQSKPHAGTFMGVFFLLVLLRVVVGIPGVLFAASGLGVFAAAADVVASWFTLMVGVGILTTLYGHIIEGRELS